MQDSDFLKRTLRDAEPNLLPHDARRLLFALARNRTVHAFVRH